MTAGNAGQIISDKDAAGRSVEFTYDSAGALTGWKASDGWQLAVARDGSGEIMNLSFSGPGNRSLSVKFARKASEVVTSYSNGISATSALDSSGKPIEIKWSGKKGALATRNYTYDARNFLTKEQGTDFIDTGAVNLQHEYKYDATGRLITTTPAKPKHDYDSAGRVATLQGTNRIVRFQWDGASQLLAAEAITETPRLTQKFSFERDAASGLVAKSGPDSTIEIWRAAAVIHEIAEHRGSKITRTRFLRGPDGDPVALVFNDQIFVLVTTPRGDVIGVASEDGSMVNHYQYDDWGGLLVEERNALIKKRKKAAAA